MVAVREILLTRDKVTFVSEDDWPLVKGRRWQAQYNSHAGKWYAVSVVTAGGKKRKVYLHRLITDCPPGLVVGHRDGDGLNNWRENLRVTTHAFNAANCCAFGSIPFRGVTREGRRYRAKINDKHLGMLGTAEEAAQAYDAAALAAWGPFAWFNFPDMRPPEARSHVEPVGDIPF